MPATAFKARGHSDVGHVEGSDVSWGRTSEDGVAMQLGVQSVDLRSAQSLAEEDTGITSVSFSFVIRLIYAHLKLLQYIVGLPNSAHTGDLPGSQEVLSIADVDFGATERQLYSLSPGPTSTRRIDVFRSKLADAGEWALSKLNWTTPEVTWRVLAPASGPFITITDAV